MAALRGNVETVMLLIENGGNMNATTSLMETRYKIVKFFLENDASLNSKNIRNETSMQLSLASMCFESLKTILDFAH